VISSPAARKALPAGVVESVFPPCSATKPEVIMRPGFDPLETIISVQHDWHKLEMQLSWEVSYVYSNYELYARTLRVSFICPVGCSVTHFLRRSQLAYLREPIL
jgi:hypothetical protein